MDLQKTEQKIKEIQEEILSLPYHKGTEHHIGNLKAKLAHLRNEIIRTQTRKKGSTEGFAHKKQGDATVVLVGMPSVGKSTLLNKLTNAHSKVGYYPFTTLDVIPGTLYYKGANIQIFDIPGLISGASAGKGGGKEILSVVRAADIVLLISSVEDLKTFSIIEKELYMSGVRLNKIRPKVFIEKKQKGGIEILGNPGFAKKTVKSICQEFKLLNAKINFQEPVSQDKFIDTVLNNRIYIPSLNIVTKIDMLSAEKQKRALQNEKIKRKYVLISAKKNIGIQELKERIFTKLEIIRIYLRPSVQSRPEKEPLICKKGTMVSQAASKISENLLKNIYGAKIKGLSAHYPNQLVGLKHVLKDNDQVFFCKTI